MWQTQWSSTTRRQPQCQTDELVNSAQKGSLVEEAIRESLQKGLRNQNQVSLSLLLLSNYIYCPYNQQSKLPQLCITRFHFGIFNVFIQCMWGKSGQYACWACSPPALDTAWWLHEGHPDGQVGSACHSSELGMWEPASVVLSNDSGPHGNQQKSFGCILCQTGTELQKKALPEQNKECRSSLYLKRLQQKRMLLSKQK
jgi:hypothetical protein